MKRVLVVDDDIDILEGLALALAENHVVATARSGVAALALLVEQRFDALILDLKMPVMDGATLIGKLRERGIDVPVLLASASHDVATVARRLGVAHVQKPFDAARVEAQLAQLVGAG